MFSYFWWRWRISSVFARRNAFASIAFAVARLNALNTLRAPHRKRDSSSAVCTVTSASAIATHSSTRAHARADLEPGVPARGDEALGGRAARQAVGVACRTAAGPARRRRSTGTARRARSRRRRRSAASSGMPASRQSVGERVVDVAREGAHAAAGAARAVGRAARKRASRAALAVAVARAQLARAARGRRARRRRRAPASKSARCGRVGGDGRVRWRSTPRAFSRRRRPAAAACRPRASAPRSRSR